MVLAEKLCSSVAIHTASGKEAQNETAAAVERTAPRRHGWLSFGVRRDDEADITAQQNETRRACGEPVSVTGPYDLGALDATRLQTDYYSIIRRSTHHGLEGGMML